LTGVTTTAIVEPRDLAALEAFLAEANRARAPVAILGNGSKRRWGSPLSHVEAVLSTRRLAGDVDHRAGDLTATVPAGATLRAVNEVLAKAGQWLPLDPAFGDRATIGGIVAAGDSGPRRHAHGGPRDLIIGIEMVRADGRVARAGGNVVKNVAGYDLARMLCGSFGTLAVITSATFKLAPLAPASRTVVASAATRRRLTDLARVVAAAPFAPSAIEIQSPPHRLLVRFETTEGAAPHQAEAVRALCEHHGAGAIIVADADEHRLWQEHERLIWTGDDNATILKVGVLPTAMGDFLEQVHGTVVGRAALGVLYVRMGSPDDVVNGTAGARTGEGRVRVLQGPGEIVDRWGDLGNALPLMRAVKAQFDPNGILNPGIAPWA
jgi:glycolate oxidase FAD binding subunit